MDITQELFGKLADGTPVDLYTLTNASGVQVKITTYGGAVVSLLTPDRDGNLDDVALGFETLEGYLGKNPYFGCIAGRYANRIAKGKFTLNGVEYTLTTNDGENHLHGGSRGFDKVVWDAQGVKTGAGVGVELTYLSKDGEEGYPGNLSAKVNYTLTDDDELRIEYLATTDADTIVNLTNHTYFNLADGGAGDILGHELMIAADRFTPVDAAQIPTGELRSVESTPMDFRQLTAIGARINQDDEQLRFSLGYDHNWVLNRTGDDLALAARMQEPVTGRVVEVYTTEPGFQFYSGNFLDGTVTGKGGRVYHKRYGLCLETQHFPDSPNRPDFPSTVLRPGETYHTTTVYKFTTAP
jgi:aldose 1-epimerase